jgi:hypothetical protein
VTFVSLWLMLFGRVVIAMPRMNTQFEQDALGIWTAPSGDKVAWFKDPDGNTLSISQHV